MKQWYLIQFKPNSHRLAERNLNRQGFETFLPMQETTRRKTSRFVNELRPLFPGYMFISVASEQAPWRTINSTIGVSRLVSLGNKPKPLPSELVSNLMRRCDEAGKVLPIKQISEGDRVEFSTGPFANFVATVESIDPQERVWVIIELLGQATRLHVTPDQF